MKSFLTIIIALLMTHSAIAQDSFLALVGTYTETDKQGINLVRFHSNRTPEIVSIATHIENPSFVISTKSGNRVYAVQETDNGQVTSLKFDSINNNLVKINTVSSNGAAPCYLTLDPSEKFLIVGNYEGGNLSVLQIGENGELLKTVQTVEHSGSSVNEERQEAAHVHSAVFHPNGRQLFVGDLGIDKVKIYDFDSTATNPLTHSFDIEVAPGSGPRHLIFDKTGDHLYLIHELTGEVGHYQNSSGSAYEHVGSHLLSEENFSGEQGGAEIRITPDGSFLYASNRGEANQLTVFKISADGKLEAIQRIGVNGENPRNFLLSPDLSQILIANQDTDEIVLFERDQTTGKVSPTDFTLSIPKPVYIFPLPK
ncbi:lactonase family protein [Litoribacter alkaliphilus]|uniref:Lactonase family protein n=1 Tax=Litoribacter ruber TaxID=702568 RepID=A0AAP2G247_9BACT|nr:lactonase family protein [Litoribacter alkaliphilus]MBS9525202.1 lactonase family protein [Litoribacter alkaliphilus]